ncbi:MAG: low specificity L-threonine aldolase [Aliidongia sp.]
MNFASDNVTGIAPEILAAIAAANDGAVASYGDDPITQRLEAKLADLFEHEVAVLPVATGTAANSLALAALVPPWGAVLCHDQSHIVVDEANAPEFYTGGAKLVTLAGADGKLSAETIAGQLPGGLGVVHHAQPAAISLTQATECGTIYRPAEIVAIAEIAHRHGLAMHMDGARFANALAFLGCSPAEATWRVGIDALSFGATKNGALAAEAIVFFDPAKAQSLAFRRKRGGHLFSKMRFLSAQLEAYVTDGLWLRQASHANAMAQSLARGLAQLPDSRLRHPVEANEIFIELPEATIAGLLEHGFNFYRWDGPDSTCIRLVTAWNTDQGSVDALIAAARKLA